MSLASKKVFPSEICSMPVNFSTFLTPSASAPAPCSKTTNLQLHPYSMKPGLTFIYEILGFDAVSATPSGTISSEVKI